MLDSPDEQVCTARTRALIAIVSTCYLLIAEILRADEDHLFND